MSHAAQEASFKSVKLAQAHDKEGWLDCFAEDAVVQDPVGISPLDPTGEGHKGREAIGAFYDLTIAGGEMNAEIISSHPSGNECANKVALTKKYSEEMIISVEMIVVYRINDAGKIESLKAYWDYQEVEKQFAG
ncbi:MAG: nuclear transport factor 2 family protein [Pseudomonadota bacterium]